TSLKMALGCDTGVPPVFCGLLLSVPSKGREAMLAEGGLRHAFRGPSLGSWRLDRREEAFPEGFQQGLTKGIHQSFPPLRAGIQAKQ
ncbi:MAG TPA: hypothetical protein VF516_43570, partial [Kofleriaceae bacterium]